MKPFPPGDPVKFVSGAPTLEELQSAALTLKLQLQAETARVSEAAVCLAHGISEHDPVVVRMLPDDGRTQRSCTIARTYTGGVSTPKMFDQRFDVVPGSVIEVWKHIEGRTGSELSPFEIGQSLAMWERHDPQKPCLAATPKYTPCYDLSNIDVPKEMASEFAAAFLLIEHSWAVWTKAQKSTPQGWTHGDWAPNNIAITPAGQYFVWDLGIAGYGPLGPDIARLISKLTVPHETNTPTPEQTHEVLQAYEQCGGQVRPEQVIELVPAMAAVSAIKVAVLALNSPGGALWDEAQERLTQVLATY